MTWLVLSWFLLCSQFLCYQPSILENPIAYRYALTRRYKPVPLPPTIEEKPTDVVWLIKYYSKKYEYDVDLALNIAWCESGYRPNAKNKTSTASWVFQFLRSTWASNSKRYLWRPWDVFNADDNIKVAIQKLKNEWPAARRASIKCRWK
jgi:soluble lytic murein transglycosylase-like protein